MTEHLRHEEHAALALVSTHLLNAESHRFRMTERTKRPPRERPQFLTWVLDDATDEDAEPVLRELPAAGRLVYRVVRRRLYDRRGLWRLEARATAIAQARVTQLAPAP